jgi:hypothetical protein
MKILRHTLAFSVLVASVVSSTAPSAQEQKIACGAVPKAVHESFKQAFPRATINSCATELEDGKRAFEITSKEGEIARDALYYADGKVIVVEESIPVTDTPRPVQDALQKAMQAKGPGGKIVRSEKVMRDGTLLYEFRVGHRGKFTEFLFEPSGSEVPKKE